MNGLLLDSRDDVQEETPIVLASPEKGREGQVWIIRPVGEGPQPQSWREKAWNISD